MLASILIPTHTHAETLPLAVASALAQTAQPLEVIIIGDGVDEFTRTVARGLADAQPQVHFLDFPKGANHGEAYRDVAIRHARSNAIAYLCDDDLLMPKHVEAVLGALDRVPFVHTLSMYFRLDGEVALYRTDLADPRAVAWHLRDPPQNRVSLTGAAHRRDAYLALPEGWTTTPAGAWPDHFMWKKFFRQPSFTARTLMTLTALQFPSHHGRATWPPEERLAEIRAWFHRLSRRETEAQLAARLERALSEYPDDTVAEATA